jgi:hypothetical protein
VVLDKQKDLSTIYQYITELPFIDSFIPNKGVHREPPTDNPRGQ